MYREQYEEKTDWYEGEKGYYKPWCIIVVLLGKTQEINLKICKLNEYELNFHYFNLTKEQKCFQYKYTS